MAPDRLWRGPRGSVGRVFRPKICFAALRAAGRSVGCAESETRNFIFVGRSVDTQSALLTSLRLVRPWLDTSTPDTDTTPTPPTLRHQCQLTLGPTLRHQCRASECQAIHEAILTLPTCTPCTPCTPLEGGEDEEDEENKPSLVTCCRPCRPPCRACMAVRIQAMSLVSKDVDCHTMLYHGV